MIDFLIRTHREGNVAWSGPVSYRDAALAIRVLRTLGSYAELVEITRSRLAHVTRVTEAAAEEDFFTLEIVVGTCCKCRCPSCKNSAPPLAITFVPDPLPLSPSPPPSVTHLPGQEPLPTAAELVTGPEQVAEALGISQSQVVELPAPSAIGGLLNKFLDQAALFGLALLGVSQPRKDTP